MRSLAARAGAVCACWHGLAVFMGGGEDPAPVNRVLWALPGAAQRTSVPAGRFEAGGLAVCGKVAMRGYFGFEAGRQCVAWSTWERRRTKAGQSGANCHLRLAPCSAVERAGRGETDYSGASAPAYFQ